MFESAFPIISTPDISRSLSFYRDLLGGVFSVWVYASDCDAAVELLRSAGTPVLEEPADQPWGERVAKVGDPDGNVVIIGSR